MQKNYLSRIFPKIPNIAFLKVVSWWPKKGRYLTMEDQVRALMNYVKYAEKLN